MQFQSRNFGWIICWCSWWVSNTQNKVQMELKFSEIGTSVKTKPNQNFYTLKQRRCRKEPVLEIEDACIEEKEEEKEEQYVLTHFSQTQKNQLLDLQDHFERYCNVLPVFGFISAKHDIYFIKSYLLPLLVDDWKIEIIVINKANQFVSFKFGVARYIKQSRRSYELWFFFERVQDFIDERSISQWMIRCSRKAQQNPIFSLRKHL